MMDYQTLFNWTLGLAVGALGWFAREVWGSVTANRADLSKLREELPKTYITKDDFKDAVVDLKNLLINIDHKLDRKADKDK